MLKPGDVVYVEPLAGKDGQFRLRQVPEISGAMVAMDPQTGRVLAMVGGFSYDQSQFNRATQALRQPGSSFKPIVYAAALDNGYTPSSVVLDAPIEIDTGRAGVWRPENYEGKFYGPSTLRFGIEQSRNVMTVRLAQDIGMPLIAEYAKRFGVYDNLPPYLSIALGAGETTVLRMVGGLFDVRQWRTQGQADADRPHPGPLRQDHLQARRSANATAAMPTKWENQPEPTLVDKREQVLDPMTAYQITSMMEGVVQRGTGTVGARGRQADRRQDRHHQRREGRLVHRLLAGPRGRRLSSATTSRAIIGDGATGGASRGADLPRFHEGGARRQAGGAVPRAARHQADPRRSEDRHARRPGDSRSILEAFKPGTAPPDGIFDDRRHRCGRPPDRRLAGSRPHDPAPAPAGLY